MIFLDIHLIYPRSLPLTIGNVTRDKAFAGKDV
jgi:hypothetical protein